MGVPAHRTWSATAAAAWMLACNGGSPAGDAADAANEAERAADTDGEAGVPGDAEAGSDADVEPEAGGDAEAGGEAADESGEVEEADGAEDAAADVERPECTVRVTDHGATGDGTTDDTAAIRRAVEAARDAGGGVVCFPAGTYLVSIDPEDRGRAAVAVYPNITLLGESREASVIRLADAQGDYDAIIGGDPAGETLVGLRVLDLGVDGNGPGNPVLHGDSDFAVYSRYALRIFDGHDILVQRCRFSNQSNVNAVTVNGPDVADVTITENDFDRIGGGSVDYDHSTVYTHGSGITVSYNTFSSREGPGTNGVRTAIEIHGDRQYVIGNTVDGFYTGVNVTGVAESSDVHVYEGNTIRRVAVGLAVWSEFYGSHTTGPALTNVVIRDNDISVDTAGWTGFFDEGERAGITFWSDFGAPIRGLEISDNRIVFDGSTGPSGWCDHFSSGITLWKWTNPDVPVEALRIAGNTIEDSPGSGIHLAGMILGGEITGNTIVEPGRSGNELEDDNRSGLYVSGTCRDMRVEDNVFRDHQAVPSTKYGFFEDSTCLADCAASRNRLDVTGSPAPPLYRTNPDPPGEPWRVE